MNCVLFAKMDQVFSFNDNNNNNKYWKCQGILSVRKNGNHVITGFLLELENLEKWEGISSQGKVGENFEETGKVGKSHKILENMGNFRRMLFVIFK